MKQMFWGITTFIDIFDLAEFSGIGNTVLCLISVCNLETCVPSITGITEEYHATKLLNVYLLN